MRRRAARPAGRGSPPSCCCATSTRSTRARARRAPRRARARRRDRRARRAAARSSRAGRRRRSIDGRGAPARCCPPSSTRTCTCARPGRSTRRTSRAARARPPRAAICGVIAMPNTDPVLDSAPLLRSLRDAAAREARIPVGFLPRDHPRACRASSSPRWPSCARRARSGFTDDGEPVAERRHAAQGAAVPAPVRRRAGAARGGPDALARRRRCTRAPSAPRSASAASPRVGGVDDGRPRRRARRLRGRARALPAPQLRRLGRGRRRRQGARLARQRARSPRTTCCSPTRTCAAWTRA